MKNILKVGIIGLGVGYKHFLAFQNDKRCKVVAVCDFDKKKVRKFNFLQNKKKEIKIYKKDIDIIKNSEIDIISIASYDSYHFKEIKECIKNKKNIFIEKPICLSLKELKKIKKLLVGSNIKISCNLNLRTSEIFKKTQKSKKFGKTFYFEGDYNSGRIEKLTKGWRGDENYHSVILSSAIHMIDLMMWFKKDTPTEVTGYANNIVTKKSKFRFDDFVVLLFKFKDNFIGKITANTGCIHPHFHNVALYGQKQTFLNTINGAYKIEKKKNFLIKDLGKGYRGKKQNLMITNFVDSIIYNKKNFLSKKYLFDLMTVCFKSIESLKTKKKIKINYS